jgi:phage FluMu protein Com
MQVKEARIKDGWVVCHKCGHKLGRIIDKGIGGLEIKCSSCKELNVINGRGLKL